MTTAQQVLDVARSQIGTVEARDGSNPYGRAYGMDRVAWCAEFQWWCFQQAKAGGLIHPKTAYTPTLADWFRGRRTFDTTPRVGDLVFYDWPDSVPRIQHVGIVEVVEPNAIVTIEGNTTSGVAGDQSNGGGVWRRRRARNGSIVGFGHPAYTAAAAAPPVPVIPKDWFDMATLEDLRSVVRAELAGVVRETTSKLPNRRGPGGGYLEGGPVDTLWGFVMDADGSGFRVEQALKALTSQLANLGTATPSGGGPALTTDDVRSLIREALADLGPLHLTTTPAS